MNFDPQLSTGAAVVMALLAASMWGTWAISLKYLGDYPLDGYFLTIFITSLLLVWGAGVLIDGPALFANLAGIARQDPSRILVTLLCGAIYANGIRLSLIVQDTIGLSLAQPIQSSIIILAGTLISAIVGGVPAGVPLSVILVACGFLMAAVTLGMLAGVYRSRAGSTGGLQLGMRDLRRSLGYVLLVGLLIPAYTLALSFGLRSTTHPQGLAVLPFMAVLSAGALLGACGSSGFNLLRRGQLQRVRHAGWRLHRWGVFSGVFHYGGNIIHTYATAFLSAVIAWPLGLTGGLWTQMWGLLYGEFRGASWRAYTALGLSVLCYLVGAALIANSLAR